MRITSTRVKRGSRIRGRLSLFVLLSAFVAVGGCGTDEEQDAPTPPTNKLFIDDGNKVKPGPSE